MLTSTRLYNFSQIGNAHKIKKERSLDIRYINIINRLKHLICAKMDNRHYDNPFEEYPNSTSNIVNAATNDVIIYKLFNNFIINLL